MSIFSRQMFSQFFKQSVQESLYIEAPTPSRLFACGWVSGSCGVILRFVFANSRQSSLLVLAIQIKRIIIYYQEKKNKRMLETNDVDAGKRETRLTYILEKISWNLASKTTCISIQVKSKLICSTSES